METLTNPEENSPILPEEENGDKLISFVPISANPETGVFHNVDILNKLLPVMEGYRQYLDDDYTPDNEADYSSWLENKIEFVNSVYPWIVAVNVGEELSGCLWVSSWFSFNDTPYEAVVGGFAFPGVDPSHTKEAIQKFVAEIFTGTTVDIIRTETDEDNRAARIAMMRAGFKYPEPRRWVRKLNGKAVNGIILSITRDEFEGSLNE